MFGLNDDDSKKSEDNQNHGDTTAQTPPNPFNNSQETPPGSDTATAPEVPLQEPPKPDVSSSISSSSGQAGNDLMDIKQKALQNLQPLVSHLEQSPEEKFKTTMMLIQATDNSELVKQAYEAANQISDEKTRAQALLDVVNEINYFAQKDTGSAENKL